MLKTPIILIKCHNRKLKVHKYMARRTHGGQLILDYIRDLGSLRKFKYLDSENAYLAIDEKCFKSEELGEEVCRRIGRNLKSKQQFETVVVTISQRPKRTTTILKPYKIRIFCSFMKLIQVTSQELVPSNSGFSITFKEGESITQYTFACTEDSRKINPKKIPKEREESLAQTENVIWLDETNYYKPSQVRIEGEKKVIYNDCFPDGKILED